MTATVPRAALRFEPATGTIGALVHSVELGATPADVDVEALRGALHEHGVLFFAFDRFVDETEFRSFATLFGEPEGEYGLTVDRKNTVIDSDLVPMPEYRVNHWHTDGSALECPPQAAMLTPVELPDAGGDTMWASMYAAWDALSSHTQRLLDGLEAEHSTVKLPFLRQDANAVHPVVPRDPHTQRQMLYVNSNYTDRIVGMSERESDAVLRMLFDHVNTPEFHVRLRWRPGTIAVWEERVTQHRGVADFVGPRKLRRVTFRGERPRA